ncbi:uncharacterized protein LY89DRAFT_732569 [Mollisia scopiformis]|uniref:CCHC-type domain-containing protein n=1 Tax=Mollisia scopiformis TaxID=149040 RepID=A0A194XCH0_MOLSC|nr:uncharacterized protein LY89DRAFT_732569 [Mollisia scopiformis]KUJ17859.1 hypothetical protein LY89DRAFT_732569 [Mollisia scopiformis]
MDLSGIPALPDEDGIDLNLGNGKDEDEYLIDYTDDEGPSLKTLKDAHAPQLDKALDAIIDESAATLDEIFDESEAYFKEKSLDQVIDESKAYFEGQWFTSKGQKLKTPIAEVDCSQCQRKGHTSRHCSAHLSNGHVSRNCCILCNMRSHRTADCPRLRDGSENRVKRSTAYLYLVVSRDGKPPARMPWYPWHLDFERWKRREANGNLLRPQTPNFAMENYDQEEMYQGLDERVSDPFWDREQDDWTVEDYDQHCGPFFELSRYPSGVPRPPLPPLPNPPAPKKPKKMKAADAPLSETGETAPELTKMVNPFVPKAEKVTRGVNKAGKANPFMPKADNVNHQSRSRYASQGPPRNWFNGDRREDPPFYDADPSRLEPRGRKRDRQDDDSDRNVKRQAQSRNGAPVSDHLRPENLENLENRRLWRRIDPNLRPFLWDVIVGQVEDAKRLKIQPPNETPSPPRRSDDRSRSSHPRPPYVLVDRSKSSTNATPLGPRGNPSHSRPPPRRRRDSDESRRSRDDLDYGEPPRRSGPGGNGGADAPPRPPYEE